MSTTLITNPQDVLKGYQGAFYNLHGHTCRARHLHGEWFQVNGEIVHRSTLEAETEHLHTLIVQKRRPQKSVVQRLIDRLRNL